MLDSLSKLEKSKYVNKIFSNVSKSYDLMNDIMSLGSHRLWKKIFIDFVELKENQYVLDLACGSGDISELLLKKYPYFKNLTLSDKNSLMLDLAKKKLKRYKTKIICNSAEDLPFKNNYFDFVLLSFGLRNFSDINKSLYEIKRVIKKKGCFFCMEFSHVNNPSFRNLVNLYYEVLPKLGSIFARNKNAYEYLKESIKLFPNQIELTKKFEYIGFREIECFDLFDGIASIHIGKK